MCSGTPARASPRACSLDPPMVASALHLCCLTQLHSGARATVCVKGICLAVHAIACVTGICQTARAIVCVGGICLNVHAKVCVGGKCPTARTVVCVLEGFAWLCIQ